MAAPNNRPETSKAYWKSARGRDVMNRWRVSPAGKRALKRGRLKKNFGLSLEDYELMVSAGNGLCWLCKRPSRNGYPLAVDHNHATKEVRGILCHQCNTGIGMLNDDPALILRAASYLTAHQQRAGV